MKTIFVQLIVTLLLSTTSLVAFANKTSLFDYLQNEEMTEVSLKMDIDKLMGMKKSTDYLPATFSTAQDNWDVKVRVRGRFRRKVCDFPPLKLKFAKDGLEAKGLGDHNDFKLVTHCSDDWNSREYVAREQLTYELYNIISESNFRTQLVQITYQDSESSRKSTRYGILIEDTDEMAERLGGVELEDQYNLPAASFTDGSLERVAMFQYMIGNADWDAGMLRNLKIVDRGNGGLTAVPYDFDFSAVVSAPYAIPNHELGQTQITDRIMRHKMSKKTYEAMRQEFLAKQNELIDHVAHYPYLHKKDRSEVLDYLGTFFTELQSGDLPTMAKSMR